MRLPSDQHARVSRSLVLRAALGALLAALAVAPIDAGASASGDRVVFVSSGVGRQIFIGGTEILYGTVFSGGSLVVADYSAAQDMRVDSPVVPTLNADGSSTYVPPAGAKTGMGFKISGTLYRVTATGSAKLNAAGVYGRLQVRGKGTLKVNGVRLRWNVPIGNLGKVPKDIRPLFRLALTGAPPPQPPPPPATVPTTTLSDVRVAGS
jgi:hypothetical protein